MDQPGCGAALAAPPTVGKKSSIRVPLSPRSTTTPLSNQVLAQLETLSENEFVLEFNGKQILFFKKNDLNGPLLSGNFFIGNPAPGAIYSLTINISRSYTVYSGWNIGTWNPSVDRYLGDSERFAGTAQCSILICLQKRILSKTECEDKDNYYWRKGCEFQLVGESYFPLLSVLRSGNVNWYSETEIGSGSYSSILGCQIGSDKVAVKIGEPFHVYGISPALLFEMSCLVKLDHPNIIRVRDFLIGEKVTYSAMVMELAEPFPRVEPSELKSYFRQMISAVGYLHSQGILHGDLKPSNFVCSAGVVKLIDFGIGKSQFLDFCSANKHFSAPYRAPEIWEGKPYSTAADVWALGCIFGEMIGKEHLFSGLGAEVSDPVQQDYMTTQMFQFLHKFLRVDPALRSSLAEISKDEWLEWSGPPPREPVVEELMRDLFPHTLTKWKAAETSHFKIAEMMEEAYRICKIPDRIFCLGYAIHEYGEFRSDPISAIMALRLAYCFCNRYEQFVENYFTRISAYEQRYWMITYHLKNAQFSFLSWTAYDIIMQLKRAELAVPLLKATYFTTLHRAHGPREMADFCCSLSFAVRERSSSCLSGDQKLMLACAMTDWKEAWRYGKEFKPAELQEAIRILSKLL